MLGGGEKCIRNFDRKTFWKLLPEMLRKRRSDNIKTYLEDIGSLMGGGQKLRIKSHDALCC
jgi:hypothetical protein